MKTNELTLKTLPKPLLDEAKEMLKGEDTVAYIIIWNGRLRVVGEVIPYEHALDERLLLTIRETDLFTDDERAENYINHHQRYPSWYAGRRDEAMLERMANDTDYQFDPKHGMLTWRKPYGRIVNGDFVYSGDYELVRADGTAMPTRTRHTRKARR